MHRDDYEKLFKKAFEYLKLDNPDKDDVFLFEMADVLINALEADFVKYVNGVN